MGLPSSCGSALPVPWGSGGRMATFRYRTPTTWPPWARWIIRARIRVAAQGPVSDGGVLVYNGGVRISDITDGTSNTVMVGEQSGPATDGSDICAAWDKGAFMGNSYTGKPRGDNSMSQYPAGAAACWNVTTVKYGLGRIPHGAVPTRAIARCSRPIPGSQPAVRRWPCRPGRGFHRPANAEEPGRSR